MNHLLVFVYRKQSKEEEKAAKAKAEVADRTVETEDAGESTPLEESDSEVVRRSTPRRERAQKDDQKTDKKEEHKASKDEDKKEEPTKEEKKKEDKREERKSLRQSQKEKEEEKREAKEASRAKEEEKKEAKKEEGKTDRVLRKDLNEKDEEDKKEADDPKEAQKKRVCIYMILYAHLFFIVFLCFCSLSVLQTLKCFNVTISEGLHTHTLTRTGVTSTGTFNVSCLLVDRLID